MNERIKFCLEWKQRWEEAEGGRVDVAELCRVFGVSRQRGYVWLRRFQKSGYDVRALEDRSRRPHTSPTAIPEPMQDVIVWARKRHPRWGPRKLRAWLVRSYPGREFPGASAMASILKRRGLTTTRRRRRRGRPTPGEPFAPAATPNAVWCIDFKGKFKTGDGEWCTPFTITDAYSRFCIRCEIVADADAVSVEHILDSAFREFGIPAAIRSDNGPPFSAPGPAGLTQLAVWLLRLGIRLERITPGKPQENGRHERFHRTLADAVASPARANARAQQRAFDLFRSEYNEERPHEALGQRPPAEVYAASSRRYPCGLVQPTDVMDGHLERVDRHGAIRWGRKRVFISTALIGAYVQLEPDAGSRWAVLFGDILLGHIDNPAVGMLASPRPRKSHVLQLQRE
ncbi:MAG TPA: DDE-type integrase/transposase/recombinase [Vicinamibacterales bacterium]|nr:DDE-type integrase/transposase/recombinase [Vicinamibacterales bacterium]